QRGSGGGSGGVVRVPDDAAGARTFNGGELGLLVSPDAPRPPLGRAFARLARVGNRHTVGLALGGGAAWGFSHLALRGTWRSRACPSTTSRARRSVPWWAACTRSAAC